MTTIKVNVKLNIVKMNNVLKDNTLIIVKGL